VSTDDAVVADVCRVMEDVLIGGASVRVRVTGRSMHPFLVSGDVVTLEPVAGGSVRMGNVILSRRASAGPVLHRVIGTAPAGGIRTRGDALRLEDEPVAAADVLGRVVRVEKADGTRIELNELRWRFAGLWTARMGNCASFLRRLGSRVKRTLAVSRRA
jgi:signal peptidase I